ncbi:MAG: hypothetical protein J5724_00940 [Ruminococcus sp.]|uniref:hypothetical protein n=1 Tax=Ruminococcus sp. TaxID=41978 RepID=UPI001B63C160|nr:hypothetical protein [Ruminococcus sp.]MBO4492931.1 hypothetical protein [Ruminococcus sp.]MBP5433960.1 hypothetical protein [Ruminococcus sp.]
MTMENAMRDALIKKCLEHYNTVYNEEINGKGFGVPPGSIVIVLGEVQKCKEWKPVSHRKAVLRYSSHGLEVVALDTVPDETENGMYFKEASAELYTTEDGAAFITLRFGKRYERCYSYTINTENEAVLLDHEKLVWVS